MIVRQASDGDFDAIWPIFREVVAPGDTYAIDPDISRDAAEALWMLAPQATFVVEEAGRVLGTGILKPNQGGNGKHVCNAAFMVAGHARGRGVASAMCGHAEVTAVRLGYRAMQFNFVVATNTGAVRLWTRLGYEIVGRLPGAFRDPERGYVDALVMFKRLAPEELATGAGAEVRVE